MKHRSKFLVIVDDSEELGVAVRFASIRAASTKGGIVLLKIIEHHDPQHWQSVEEIILQEARDEAQEKAETKSQEDICEEESLYNFPPAEDNKILPGFHEADWDKKLSYLQKFKDKRFHYFGKKLLYQEKPDLLPKEDYDEIHGTIVKRVLSTTDDKKWNTIPRTYKEIDDLRAKFEKSKETDKLKMLEEINAYVEELEKVYSRA